MALLVEDDDVVLPGAGGSLEGEGGGSSNMSAGGLAPLSAAADLDLSIPPPNRRAGASETAADDAASAATQPTFKSGFTVKSGGEVQSNGGSSSRSAAVRLESTIEHYRELLAMSAELNTELGRAVTAQNPSKLR